MSLIDKAREASEDVGLPKAFCPGCKRNVPVRATGHYREHRADPSFDVKCEASGLLPEEYAKGLRYKGGFVTTSDDQESGNGQVAAGTPEDEPAAKDEKQFVDSPIPEARRVSSLSVLTMDSIVPSERNPRENIENVEDLAQSIAAVGLIQRIKVKPLAGGRFEIVAGHRRFAAAQHLGWTEIPAEVEDLSDRDTDEQRLVENIQREDLSPLEEARALADLTKKYGYSQRALADRVGRSQSHISKRLALLELPEQVVEKVIEGTVSLDDAQQLGKLKELPKKHLESALRGFSSGNSYDSMEKRVKRELSTHKRTEKFRKKKKELKDAGTKIITQADWWKLDHTSRALIGKGYGDLDIEAKAHASEPCHAALVDEHQSSIKLVCTDVSRHRKKAGESTLKGSVVKANHPTTASRKLTPEQEEATALVARLTEIETARREFIKNDLLAAKVNASDAVAIELMNFTVDAPTHYGWDGTDVDLLLQFLGQKRQGYGNEAKAVAKWAEETAGAAEKFAMASAVASLELSLTVEAKWGPPVVEPWGPAFQPYFDFLEASGYAVSDLEREHLKAPAKKRKAS